MNVLLVRKEETSIGKSSGEKEGKINKNLQLEKIAESVNVHEMPPRISEPTLAKLCD